MNTEVRVGLEVIIVRAGKGHLRLPHGGVIKGFVIKIGEAACDLVAVGLRLLWKALEEATENRM